MDFLFFFLTILLLFNYSCLHRVNFLLESLNVSTHNELAGMGQSNHNLKCSLSLVFLLVGTYFHNYQKGQLKWLGDTKGIL